MPIRSQPHPWADLPVVAVEAVLVAATVGKSVEERHLFARGRARCGAALATKTGLGTIAVGHGNWEPAGAVKARAAMTYTIASL